MLIVDQRFQHSYNSVIHPNIKHVKFFSTVYLAVVHYVKSH